LFDLDRVEVRGETEARDDIGMTLKGVYSYDPNLQQVSEIEGLSQFMKSGAAGFSRTGPPDPLTRREYLPTHIRVIS
jgi:hypothetical protein